MGPPSPTGAPAGVVLLALAQRCTDPVERFAALKVLRSDSNPLH